MPSPTMTLSEVVTVMRKAGFKTGEASVANAIEAGRYPFGQVVGQGKTGRRKFEIFRVDFEKWLKEKGCVYEGTL